MDITVNNVKITLTPEQLQQIAEEHTPTKQIELQGGRHTVLGDGTIGSTVSTTYIENGTTFKTEELAERASKEIRKANRLRARAYEIDSSEGTSNLFVIYYKHNINKYHYIEDWEPGIGTILMSATVAKQIVDELNSGRFVL